MSDSSKELRRQVGRMLRSGPRVLPIVQAGDPVLRRVAEPYDGQLSDELFAELVEAMRLTMHDAPGVGLAAPQIGLSLALAVAEDAGEPDEEDPRERAGLYTFLEMARDVGELSHVPELRFLQDGVPVG